MQTKEAMRKKKNKLLLIQGALGIIIVLMVFNISYTIVKMMHGESLIAFQTSATQPDASVAATSELSVQAPPEGQSQEPPAEVPSQQESKPSWDTLSPLEQTINSEMITVDSKMLALPENGRVDIEYFRTALFIGDSLTQGFGIYDPLREVAQVCAYLSVGPKAILENASAKNASGEYELMLDTIYAQQPENIYLLLGTNALIAQEDDAFLHYYGQLMDALREHFPAVPIYVQSITPVTSEQEEKQPRLANSRIRRVNNAVAQMAYQKGMHFVDVQEALADDTGCLRADYVGTYDGIHMNPTGYAEWADYLATHTAYNPYTAQFMIA